MNAFFRKRSLRLGIFVAHTYGIFFHPNRDYQCGTDADHISAVPGTDYAPDIPLGDKAVARNPLENKEAIS